MVEETLWHPVAASTGVVGAPVAARLLERELVLWRAGDVLPIVRMVDLPIARMVVQVGAGQQYHGPILDGGVEVLQVSRIGPRLVRRMRPFLLT